MVNDWLIVEFKESLHWPAMEDNLPNASMKRGFGNISKRFSLLHTFFKMWQIQSVILNVVLKRPSMLYIVLQTKLRIYYDECKLTSNIQPFPSTT